MGQIVSAAAKPKRCNLNQLSQVPIPADGEHILVSSNNSMNAAGQGNFDCYIEGDGHTAATALELKQIGVDREFEVYSETEELVMANYQTSPYVIMGKYINPDGTLGNSASYFYTKPILLKSGDTIYYNLRGSGIGYLCTATSEDDEGPYMVLLSGNPSNANRNYTAQADIYVVLCGQTMIANNYIRFNVTSKGLVLQIEDEVDALSQQMSLTEEAVSKMEKDLVYSGDTSLETTMIDGVFVNTPNISAATGQALYYVPCAKDDQFRLNAIFNQNKLRTGFTTEVPALYKAITDYQEESYTTASGEDRTFIATADGYFCFSLMTSGLTSFTIYKLNTGLGGKVYKLNERVDEVENDIVGINSKLSAFEQIDAELTFTSGYYITSNGAYNENASFKISNVFELKYGETINIVARGYLANIAILARVSGNSYIPKIISADGVTKYTYTNDEATGYFVISSSNSFDTSASIIHIAQVTDLSTTQGILDNIFAGISPVGVIGDSLASGSTDEGSFRDYSWWKVLERDSGATYHGFCAGGMSTRSFLTNNNYGMPVLKSTEQCALYIIGLGVNDRSALGDDYLGSVSDIDTADYTNNGDTYYGNYARIVQMIQEYAPNARIIMLTDARYESGFNVAVRTIAQMFGCFVLDLYNDYASLYAKGGIFYQFQGTTAHYSKLGYMAIGKFMEKALSNVILDNLPSFKDI